MKTAAIFAAAALVVAACTTTGSGSGQDSAETKLPDPQKAGGPGIFSMMQQRTSAAQATFPSGKLSQSDLSTLLWAASGKNRDGSKWTVPMAMGKPPYCKIYIATDEGAYLYSWQNNSLVPLTKTNIKADIATQEFGKKAPVTMVFVSDGDELAKLPNPTTAEEFAIMLTGAMSQNVYLASEALGIGTRLVYSVDREKTAKHLKLGAKDKVICAMLMGKK